MWQAASEARRARGLSVGHGRELTAAAWIMRGASRSLDAVTIKKIHRAAVFYAHPCDWVCGAKGLSMSVWCSARQVHGFRYAETRQRLAEATRGLTSGD